MLMRKEIHIIMSEAPSIQNTIVPRRTALLASGGLIGAILASSCCILPLALVTLGISGAWIGKLAALSSLQPLFVVSAAIFIGAGLWNAYKVKNTACSPDSLCGRPHTQPAAKAILWFGALVTVASVAVDFLPIPG